MGISKQCKLIICGAAIFLLPINILIICKFMHGEIRCDFSKIVELTLSLTAVHISFMAFIISVPTIAQIRVATNFLHGNTQAIHILVCNEGNFEGGFRLIRAEALPSNEDILVPSGWMRLSPHSFTEVKLNKSLSSKSNSIAISFEYFSNGKSEKDKHTIYIQEEKP